MKGHPTYQNRIWKWDFAPAGDRSGTRKGWRLFAFVPDPKAPEPILAVAFLVHDKSVAPENKYYPKFLADKLKEFLSETVLKDTPEDHFRHQTDPQGKTISLCCDCFATVAISSDLSEIESLEATHNCKPEQAETAS